MMRADRLPALVAELRTAAPDPLPAATLAQRLGVSESTVRRDLALLARAGLPLRFERGHGYTVPQPAPPPVLSEATSLVGPLHETLTAAVRGRRVVRLDYTGASGERTRRDVEAHGLVVAPYGEYLVGWCRMREGPRLFRLDRIGAAYLTEREAGLRDLDELLAVLRVPPPRRPADDVVVQGPVGAARARSWTLDRFQHTSDRLADTLAQIRSNREGAARARTVLGHLAEWTRWQIAAIRAVSTGGELTFDGNRPPFPATFEDDHPYTERERMIQDAMAPRSLAEVARDLHMILRAASQWAASCQDALWQGPLPDPARPGNDRPLADLLAGWHSPLAHIEWHLDRLADGPVAAFDVDEEDEIPLVEHCPLQG